MASTTKKADRGSKTSDGGAPKANGIVPEDNVFDDGLLDSVGQEYRTDHPKGQSEWAKNCVDVYIRADVPDAQQVILIELAEAKPKRNSVFRMVDFVGMTSEDIEEAFKRWGDRQAAKRGTSKVTLGGHGNGGKFYMRQAFETSHFVTYKDGKLNVYGFNEDKKYGFLAGYRDLEMSLEEALVEAELDPESMPEEARKRLAVSQGFTVVVGEKPVGFSGRATAKGIIEKFVDHPQARGLVDDRPVYCRVGRELGEFVRLESQQPDLRDDFAERVIEIPHMLVDENGDEQTYRDEQYRDGTLILKVAAEDLQHIGANRVDFYGQLGNIGSYPVHELGGPVPPGYEFIFGDCTCPKLEDPEDNQVMNDRAKLVDSPKSRALLTWVREQVAELATEIAALEARERREQNLQESSAFNKLLNEWKNGFMPDLMATLFGGSGSGSAFGGAGNGTGEPTDGDGTGDGDNDGDGDPPVGSGDEGGDGDQPRTGSRAPIVLLSSEDADPLNLLDGEPVSCFPRHPAVYQRPADVPEGIYWINTSKPIAETILDRYGPSSARWRDYMFQRYIEIILKETIRELERKQGAMTADEVEGKIDTLYSEVFDRAQEDLGSFLFDEKVTG